MTDLKHHRSPDRKYKIFLLSGLGIGMLGLLIYLSHIFIPVGIALLIAYILNPVISFMDRHHSRRVFTVSMVYVLFLALVFGSGLFLGPALIEQAGDFVIYVKDKSVEYGFSDQLLGTNTSPETPSEEKGWWEQVFKDAPEVTVPPSREGASSSPDSQYPSPPSTSSNSPHALDQLFERYGSFINNKLPLIAMGSLKAIFNGAGTLFAFLIQLLLTLFYAFFFILHFPKIRDTLCEWIPHSQTESVQDFFSEMDEIVAGFFRGRLLVCVLSAIVMSVGLFIAGIPYWLLLGIAAGFLGMIPFIGVTVTLIPCVLIAMTSEHMVFSLVGVLMTFGIVQGIVEPFIGPFVISYKVSLHPVTIVIVLMIGAALFGVLGLLLAIPLFGILKLFARRVLVPTLNSVMNEENV
ncbi:AI-2E family transporter [Kiritimatiellota bacterium B12222]|nr:AI-2E family transporter [Kiritimatiellota bacterium B12222]